MWYAKPAAFYEVSFRNIHLHPICLPDWNRLDEENKPTVTKMYRYTRWEKYQTLYSLKAMHKDARFTNVWTDVNGPSKFVVRFTLEPRLQRTDIRSLGKCKLFSLMKLGSLLHNFSEQFTVVPQTFHT